jgi:hypothetical protein
VTCLWPLAASYAASLQGVLLWRPVSDEQLLVCYADYSYAQLGFHSVAELIAYAIRRDMVLVIEAWNHHTKIVDPIYV